MGLEGRRARENPGVKWSLSIKMVSSRGRKIKVGLIMEVKYAWYCLLLIGGGSRAWWEEAG